MRLIDAEINAYYVEINAYNAEIKKETGGKNGKNRRDRNQI